MATSHSNLNMRVLLISFSFVRGGAGIAAAKSFRLLHRLGIDSSGASAEYSPMPGENIRQPRRLEFMWHFLLRGMEHLLLRCFFWRDIVKGSLNLFTAPVISNALKPKSSESPVVHVHWINNSTLSVRSLGCLPVGSIVSLHDEWLCLGVEHYELDDRVGAAIDIRQLNTVECFIDGWVKRRKCQALLQRNDILYTTPSRWLLEKARRSRVLAGKDIRLLPNPIDTDYFHASRENHRKAFKRDVGIDNEAIVIGFGAVDFDTNPLKGGVLLEEALRSLVGQGASDIAGYGVLLLFGAGSENIEDFGGMTAIGLGHIVSEELMRKVYDACDFLVVPSLVEAFGQAAAESLACETPVICFDHGGLRDIVDDSISGLMAEPFSISSLADCIRRMFYADSGLRQEMGRRGREQIVRRFSLPVVAQSYQSILEDAAVNKLIAGTSAPD